MKIGRIVQLFVSTILAVRFALRLFVHLLPFYGASILLHFTAQILKKKFLHQIILEYFHCLCAFVYLTFYTMIACEVILWMPI